MYARTVNVREEFVGYEFQKYVTFEIASKDLKVLPERCELTISEYSPNRNTDQNAKYWSIVGEIARITGESKAAIHNQLLNDYGEVEYVEDNPVTIMMPMEYDYLGDHNLHLFPTGRLFVIDGDNYAEYYKLIDSKDMTVKQFSRLIDGAKYERECVGN